MELLEVTERGTGVLLDTRGAGESGHGVEQRREGMP